jgi:hypothetical protein
VPKGVGASGAPVQDSAAAATPPDAVLTDLVERLAALAATQARAYEALAARAQGDLRQALADLARAKHDQVADLAPLAEVREAGAPAPPPAASCAPALSWGRSLGEAYQGERALEWTGRELAGLARDPALRVLAARLAAGAARDGRGVRKLYLRYS